MTKKYVEDLFFLWREWIEQNKTEKIIDGKVIRLERPIAYAALQLDVLCRCEYDKHKDRIWQLAEVLFGKSNVSLWKDHGGIEKIREMIRKNLDVFQSADTTGAGFFRRLFKMWFSGEFVDETGTDLMGTALASGDDELKGNLVYLIIEKMGIGERVVVACVSSYERNGELLAWMN